MSESRTPFALSPWVRRLLLATGGVYLLQLSIFTGPWLAETFGFRPDALLSRPWTAVTFAFIHGSFLHVLGNMFGLFVFGVPVERRLGSRTFVRLYLAATLGGALLSLLLAPLTGDGLIIGASAGVFGVLLAFVLEWPDAPVFVFPLPFPIRVRWLAIGFAGLSLLFGLLPARDGVAHMAHLGGFAGAWLYLRGGRWLARPRTLRVTERPPAVLVRPPAADATRRDGLPVPPQERGGDTSVKAEVDRVLDKISALGLESLTAEERRFLDEMSRRFRQEP